MLNETANKISKPKKKVASKATIKKPTHLYLNDKFISLLTNIGSLENLSVLYLHNNHISKIENLESAVNLKLLYLQKNNISKIENLGCLKNLSKLYLGHNQISVVEGLERLVNLEELHLEKQLLNGDSLCFDPRTVYSISNSLLLLDISKNNITSIVHLTPLKNIKVLIASHNKLSNIEEVSDTLRYWYYLCEATFTGNPMAKQHRYREKPNCKIQCSYVTVLDGKEVNETTRCFMKRFAKERVNQCSRQSINLADKLSALPKNYPLPIQKAVSQSILEAKPCFDDTTLACNVDDIYLPWKTMHKSSSNIGKKFPALLKIKKNPKNLNRIPINFPYRP